MAYRHMKHHEPRSASAAPDRAVRTLTTVARTAETSGLELRT